MTFRTKRIPVSLKEHYEVFAQISRRYFVVHATCITRRYAVKTEQTNSARMPCTQRKCCKCEQHQSSSCVMMRNEIALNSSGLDLPKTIPERPMLRGVLEKNNLRIKISRMTGRFWTPSTLQFATLTKGDL